MADFNVNDGKFFGGKLRNNGNPRNFPRTKRFATFFGGKIVNGLTLASLLFVGVPIALDFLFDSKENEQHKQDTRRQEKRNNTPRIKARGDK